MGLSRKNAKTTAKRAAKRSKKTAKASKKTAQGWGVTKAAQNTAPWRLIVALAGVAAAAMAAKAAARRRAGAADPPPTSAPPAPKADAVETAAAERQAAGVNDGNPQPEAVIAAKERLENS